MSLFPCAVNRTRRAPLWGAAVFLAISLSGAAVQADQGGDDTTVVIAPEFKPPAPGSYELMHIMKAPGGKVLDLYGVGRDLSDFTGGKITLLSFIYSSCADPAGCPYAYIVFHSLQNRLEHDPRYAGKVRLLSLSFDPARDTPEMLRLYAGDNAKPGRPVEWTFLTTASVRDLLPILDDYGQDVYLEKDPATGKWLGTFSHVLKVFLIDQHHEVREIYMTAFLTPDMVYNDILTLLMETEPKP